MMLIPRERVWLLLASVMVSLFATLAGAAEPWAWVDLSPALNNPLISDSINDEGLQVTAEPDKVFLTIPIRYDPAAGNRVVNRTVFKAKDLHGFYGIRLLPDPPGPLNLDTLSESPVFEKWELRQNASGRGQVTARNTAPPRQAEKDKDPKTKLTRRQPITIPASGWLAVIIEIPKSMRNLKFGWADLSETPVDIGFIKRCRDPIPDPPRLSSEGKLPEPPAALLDIIKLIDGKNTPMESLAIRRLATVRGQWSTQTDGEFLARVDRAVLEAALRQPADASVSAWVYFGSESALQPPACWIAPRALDRVAQASPQDQRRWIDLLSAGLGIRKSGAAWLGIACEPRTAAPTLRLNCIALLSAILRGEDPENLSTAWDILLTRFGNDLDLAFLEKTSSVAREALLDRLPTIRNRTFEIACLRGLMGHIEIGYAKRIAAHARRLRMELSEPQDPILLQWEHLRRPEHREAFLSVLAGVKLDQLAYSPRVAAIIDYCTSGSLVGDEKTTALQFLLNIGETAEQSSPEVFSLLMVRTAQDPIIKGLLHVLADGDDNAAQEAALCLIRRGLAEEAARTICEAIDSSRQNKIVQMVFNQENLPADIKVAFAGFLLRVSASELASMALDYLSRFAGTIPPETRWRLTAAVRAGANPGELDLLSSKLKGSAASSALRWLHELGHMSAQDRQRLAGAKTPADRLNRLREIDYRRARIVDGRYGVLAVIETVAAQRSPPTDEQPDGVLRWSAPFRATLLLPEIEIDSGEDLHEKSSKPYSVRIGSKQIGKGVISDRPGIVGGPATFSIALDSLQWHPESGGAAEPGRESEGTLPGSKSPMGPLYLASRRVLEPARAGTMTIDVGAAVGDALNAQRPVRGLSGDSVPRPWMITLRYAAFGSFYGAGEARPAPTDDVKDRQIHIRNVMVLLERKE